MSKLFFKGRLDARQNHVTSGYNVNRVIKAGSPEAPLSLVVSTPERQLEIEAVLAEHELVANLVVDATQAENILELETIINKPQTITFAKVPSRNEPCLCGSGKKYKKCCA